jgi:hypothetical protein
MRPHAAAGIFTLSAAILLASTSFAQAQAYNYASIGLPQCHPHARLGNQPWRRYRGRLPRYLPHFARFSTEWRDVCHG